MPFTAWKDTERNRHRDRKNWAHMSFDGPFQSIKRLIEWHELFGSNKRHEVLGGWKKSGSNKSHELFGSIKKHKVSRGEDSIKNMRFLGTTST